MIFVRYYSNLFWLMCFTMGVCVIMDPDASENSSTHHRHQGQPESEFSDEDPKTFADAFRTCLAKKSYGALECANRGALSTLQAMNEDNCLDFGEVKLEMIDGKARDIFDLDWDPKDFGNVMKAASRLMERRNLKWDLSKIYPGLQMRIGPTLSGDGVLEFVVDESRTTGFHNRQVGTGKCFFCIHFLDEI